MINAAVTLMESYYSLMIRLINRNVGCDNALDELAIGYLTFLGSRNMIITPDEEGLYGSSFKASHLSKRTNH